MDGASQAYGAIGEATVLGAANTLRRASLMKKKRRAKRKAKLAYA